MDEEKSGIPNTNAVDKNDPNYVEDPSKRDFMKKALLFTAAAVVASKLTAGCNPIDASEKKDDPLYGEKVDELNRQFYANKEKHLNNDHTFNYGRYTENFPNLEQYIPIFDEFSFEIQKKYKIDSNVMKALSASIVCSNLGNWEQIDSSKDLNKQRTGPMQFQPVNVLPHVNGIFKRDFSIEEANIPENNIYFGMIYLAEGLKNVEVRNNDPNKDMLSLVLAHYYGGKPLVDVVRSNSKAEGTHYLTPNYKLHEKTVRVLNGESIQQPVSVNAEAEKQVVFPEEVWKRVEDMFPNSKFKQNRHNFEKQVTKYAGTFGLNEAEILALLVSVAMAESSGGINTFNADSGTDATGWYQLVPDAKHLEDYNEAHLTNYTYDQVRYNDDISIEVGVWALMRYKHNFDLHKSLKFFKAGGKFGTGSHQTEDYNWWYRVSNFSKNILGYDAFKMG